MKKLILTLLLSSSIALGQANPINYYPANVQLVASGTVLGQSATLAAFTIYTPPSTGIYEVCSGWVVTSASSTGGTLVSALTWNNGGAVHTANFTAAGAATAVGADSSTGSNAQCINVYQSAGHAIQVAYTIGGSPTTPPTYTYWYTVIRK